MWTIATVCLSVGHDHEPYNNGPADRNAIWGVYFRAQGTMYTMEARIPERKAHLGGVRLIQNLPAVDILALILSSMGSSDEASGYQSAATAC